MGILYCSILLNKVNADFMGSKHKKTVVNHNGLNKEKMNLINSWAFIGADIERNAYFCYHILITLLAPAPLATGNATEHIIGVDFV